MLPLIKRSHTRPQSELIQQSSRLKKSTISKISKSTEQALQYEQKCENQLRLNIKLKQILSGIRENIIDASQTINEQQDEIAKLVKQRRKQETDLQHQAHILNVLISDNAKLKEQVNSERNKRAIYFNVYKNLEHEIHQWEGKYRNLLIQSMKSEGAITKLKEKFRKATKKIERDILLLNQQLNGLSKLDPSQQKYVIHVKSPKDFSKPEGLNSPSPPNENQQKQKINKNRKSVDNELQYELEQKTIALAGILNRLKHITGLNDMEEIKSVYKGIDNKIEVNYGLFKQQEKKQKELLDKLHQYQEELDKIETENTYRPSQKVPQVEGVSDVTENTKRIMELQLKLEEKIGIKVSDLSNQMLLHHCLRVRDEKKEGKKNLEKYLEQTKKQRPEHTILLSPKQMHKKIIQGQTSLI